MIEILKSVVFSGLVCWVGTVHAADIIQSVDPQKSTIEFVVDSSWLSFSGQINKYSGSFTLRSADLSPQSLEFEIELWGLTINASPEASLQLSSLLAALPVTNGRFKSKRIVRQRRGGYIIEGDFTQGQTTRPLNFVAKQIRISRNESIIEVAQQGKASQLEQSIRPPFIPLDSQGRLRAKLVFVARGSSPTREHRRDSVRSREK